MKILVACEESQAVTIELRRLGHEAYSCDILPCSGGHPEWHLQEDVVPLLKEKWDMIIAFPPCTYLSNAGAPHLFPKGVLNQERYEKGLKAKELFLMFLNADCPHIAVENPVSSRIYNMPPASQEIQPYWFGHPYTKKTRLWLRGLPLLKPTNVVTPTGAWCTGRRMHGYVKGASELLPGNKAVNRAKTFPGIAKAMAEQWAGDIREQNNLAD